MLDPAEVLEKLQLASELDIKRAAFGASTHKYKVNPPLSEAEIVTAEQKYSMQLPDDYRTFLREVGNGGAGPYYGLFKLGEEDDGHGHTTWERGGLIGDLEAPFPHREAWNLPDTFWAEGPWSREYATVEEQDAAGEAWDAQLIDSYWATSVMNGAIPICHCGCARRQWLVLTGSERGNVWDDMRVDNAGVAPLIAEGGMHLDFAGWYLGWLDRILEAAPQGPKGMWLMT
jgi:hypothetical protein